jgi:hypothetical protein
MMTPNARLRRPVRAGLSLAFGLGFLATIAAADPELAGRPVPEPAKTVLIEILARAKLAGAKVTSTTRTAEEQARVMFAFVNQHGLDAALELYGPHGDAIVTVCKKSVTKHGKCVEAVLPKLIEETRHQLKLLEQQGDKRTELMHTSDSHFTIDIDPESISDRPAFERAVTDDQRVTRFLRPPLDRNSYHLEIPKR